MRPTCAAFAALVVCALATAASPAHADTYTVHACRTPAGVPAPAAGWQGTKAGSAEATNGCAPAGLGVALIGGGPWDGGTGANQQFTAPADTRIVRVRMRRTTAGLAPSGGTSLGYYLRADTRMLEGCAPGPGSNCVGDLTGDVDAAGLDAGLVRFNAGCGAFFPDTCGGAPLRVDVSEAAVTLRDAIPPTVSNVRVSDADGTSTKVTLGFDAADRGGGVYRRLVKVDGKLTAADPVAGETCTDAAPADTDPYQFVAPAPCPTVVSGLGQTVDVSKLPAGEHVVEVQVEDAAGNAATVYGPETLPRLNGERMDGAATQQEAVQAALGARVHVYFQANKKRAFSSRYGRRVVVRGNLRDAKNRPVVGARLDVYHLVGGKKSLVKTGLKSRKGGRITVILPMNLGTRKIQFAYRALRPGKITHSQTLSLTVRDGKGRLVTKPLDAKGPQF
ncbi:MAG: hypothetical protein JHC95_20465 [Solirubrobacteraceae bacterium]|nr:hypothetical protein [Solirubrobacteraceae bacterium]